MSGEIPVRIGDLLRDLPARTGIDAPLEAAKVWTHWVEIVGSDIAEHAEPTSLKQGVMRVRAESPAWATEIGYLAEEVRGRVNAVLGAAVVSEVRVWTGPGTMARSRMHGSDHARSGGETRRRTEGREEDPETVFRRARAAWSRRRKGHSPEPS